MQRLIMRPPPKERPRGQAMVEFALLAPLFFLFLFGIIQFGVTFGSHIGLSNAAREVARYASTAPINSAVATQAQMTKILPYHVFAYNRSETTTVTYCHFPNPVAAGTPQTYSYRVTVAVTYGNTLFVPLVGLLVDGLDGSVDSKFRTGAREQMRVETPPVTGVGGVPLCNPL